MTASGSGGEKLSLSRRKLLVSLRHKKHRAGTGLFLVEGLRGVREALRHGLVEEVYFSGGRSTAELEESIPAEITVRELGPAEFGRISQTVTPQGVASLCRCPQWSREDLAGDGPLLVIDGVADPGNFGSILRSGWALGARGVVAGPGAADPLAPGSVRGSMGAVFTLPFILVDDLPGELARLKQAGQTIVAADTDGEAALGEIPVPEKSVVILGNEARGPSPGVVALADHRLRIPQAESAGSMSVAAAAAIFLYHLSPIGARGRGRRQ
ncbi:TrmH family RNA methyltransferase [candidate division KSB1 bacterium]